MRVRWRSRRAVVGRAVVVCGLVFASGAATLWGGMAAQAGRPGPESTGGRLNVLYTPPVLVRAGERVVVPVDAVCATAQGTACRARVTMDAGAGSEPMRTASATASPGLRFDLSAPAARAVVGGSPGFVRFSIEAEAGGARTSLPPGPPGSPLLFYVAKSIPSVRVPSVSFGRQRRGRAVLALPWGTGPARAGIALGDGDVPEGPSSFDVDRSGRVFLLDDEQARLGVFAGGRLVRSTSLPLTTHADVALSPAGTAFVLSPGPDDRLGVTPVAPGGAVGSETTAASGIPGAIRAVGGAVYVHVFPLDAWVRVPGTARSETAGLQVGEPLAGDRQLLSVVRGRRLRLGTVVDGRVRDAVELAFGRALGQLALAAPDGRGGYWAVVHVWRGGLHAADAFQAVRVDGDRVLSTFLMPSRTLTPESPQSAFRIGPDGALYQLRSLAGGVRVVRYRTGGKP
jgi:hypothetical protein